jgi:Ca2+-binding EF-hand superfamily protein
MAHLTARNNRLSERDSFDRFRNLLQQRGSAGLLSIAKLLKLNADRRTQIVTARDFVQTIKDLRYDLSLPEIERVFAQLDKDHDGQSSVDEVIYSIRGPIDPARKATLTQLFDLLDRVELGIIPGEVIRNKYDATRHPDVISGRRRDEEALTEFFTNLDTYMQLKDIRDNTLTYEEFIDFFTFTTLHLTDPTAFNNYINGVWRMGDVRPKTQDIGGRQPGDTPRNHPVSQTPVQGSPQRIQQKLDFGDEAVSAKVGRNIDMLVNRIRNLLSIRGARGFIGLERQLRVLDLNCDGYLEVSELRKALKDYRVDLTEQEFASTLSAFDPNRNGLFDFNEFMRVILVSTTPFSAANIRYVVG